MKVWHALQFGWLFGIIDGGKTEQEALAIARGKCKMPIGITVEPMYYNASNGSAMGPIDIRSMAFALIIVITLIAIAYFGGA